MKQLRIVCGTTTSGSSPYHSKPKETDGRHTSINSLTSNGQQSTSSKKSNDQSQQNGSSDLIERNRPAGASVMNARDPMSKQKMSNICEPGPLKRAQGIASKYREVFLE